MSQSTVTIADFGLGEEFLPPLEFQAHDDGQCIVFCIDSKGNVYDRYVYQRERSAPQPQLPRLSPRERYAPQPQLPRLSPPQPSGSHSQHVYQRERYGPQPQLPRHSRPQPSGSHSQHVSSSTAPTAPYRRNLFSSGKIAKPVRNRRNEVDTFLDSDPRYRPIYVKMVEELEETIKRRAEMEDMHRNKNYLRKHAPIKFDTENVQDVMHYIMEHPDFSN